MLAECLDRRSVEPERSGALTPAVNEGGGGGLALGRSGPQDDVFDLTGVCASADLVLELAECVVDLVATLRELTDHPVTDAGDLPSTGPAGGSPANPELE